MNDDIINKLALIFGILVYADLYGKAYYKIAMGMGIRKNTKADRVRQKESLYDVYYKGKNNKLIRLNYRAVGVNVNA